MACLPQLGSVPAAYAVVAGGGDWPLPRAVALSNNDVIALRFITSLKRDFHPTQRNERNWRNT